jgi:hypothetical protein
VAHVHAEGDLGLSAVTAEMTFADEETGEQPLLEFCRHASASLGMVRGRPGVFHRKVSRGTSGALVD